MKNIYRFNIIIFVYLKKRYVILIGVVSPLYFLLLLHIKKVSFWIRFRIDANDIHRLLIFFIFYLVFFLIAIDFLFLFGVFYLKKGIFLAALIAPRILNSR